MVAFFFLEEKKKQCCRDFSDFRKTLDICLYRHHAIFILTLLPTSCTICITDINRQSFYLIPRNIFSQKYIKWGINSNLSFRRQYKHLQPRDFMELITIAGRPSVQNISSSNGELLSLGCSHSEFPILLHCLFGSCHSQCPALSWFFICSFPDLVCTIYTSLAIFHTPDLSSQNLWFSCYSTNFVQKMMWHYFWSGSVGDTGI